MMDLNWSSVRSEWGVWHGRGGGVESDGREGGVESDGRERWCGE